MNLWLIILTFVFWKCKCLAEFPIAAHAENKINRKKTEKCIVFQLPFKTNGENLQISSSFGLVGVL